MTNSCCIALRAVGFERIHIYDEARSLEEHSAQHNQTGVILTPHALAVLNILKLAGWRRKVCIWVIRARFHPFIA
jgi:hypothetical protein